MLGKKVVAMVFVIVIIALAYALYMYTTNSTTNVVPVSGTPIARDTGIASWTGTYTPNPTDTICAGKGTLSIGTSTMKYSSDPTAVRMIPLGMDKSEFAFQTPGTSKSGISVYTLKHDASEPDFDIEISGYASLSDLSANKAAFQCAYALK